MPQIKTRGKNPGIRLVQGEATRWRATIEDIKAIRRNETNVDNQAKLDTAFAMLDKLLGIYGPKPKDAPEADTTPETNRRSG